MTSLTGSWRPHADPIDWEARAHAAEATLAAVVSEVEGWEADAANYIGIWGQHLPCTVPTMAEKIRAVLQRGPEVATKPVPDLAEAERQRRIGIIDAIMPDLFRGIAQLRRTGTPAESVSLPTSLNPTPEHGPTGTQLCGLPVTFTEGPGYAHIWGEDRAQYTVTIEEKP